MVAMPCLLEPETENCRRYCTYLSRLHDNVMIRGDDVIYSCQGFRIPTSFYYR